MGSIGYPPLWPFVEAAIYDLYALLGFSDRFLYYFMLKQPMILGDVAVAYLLLRLLRDASGIKAGERAFVFWMLCPFVIVISAVWGMFDQVVLAFVLAGVVVIDRTTMSSLFEFVGTALKGFPAILIPPLAMSQKGLARRVWYFLLALGLVVLFSLAPYLLFRDWNVNFLFGTGTDIVSKVGNSLNYGVVVYVLSELSILPATAFDLWRLAGYVWIPAVVLAYLYCFWGVRRDSHDARWVGASLLFVVLVYFLTRLNLNEQFVTYFLAFGLIDVLSWGEKRARLFTGVWTSATVFLVANNAFMVRFLAPVSLYFTQLNDLLTSGGAGYVRFGVMIASGLVFTAFTILYLKSLSSDIRNGSQPKGAPLDVSPAGAA